MLVLSLFPGIGLLDMAFEEAGCCVVRGPDLLWGGNVKLFHPPAGHFAGVIGGPPCQRFSRFTRIGAASGKKVAANLIPEFERCVQEAQPDWFLMENVMDAPPAQVGGYSVASFLIDNRWLGEEQHRERRISFGRRGTRSTDLRQFIEWPLWECPQWANAVLSSGAMKPGTEGQRGRRPGRDYGYHSRAGVAESLRLQGLPADFFGEDCPLTIAGQQKVIGNGVPLPMGRALAGAVLRAVRVPT